MAESTLNLTLTDLESEVGSYCGWGRDPKGWTERQQQDITACVSTALRKFYFSAKVGDEPVHGWTFLKPVATITILSGQTTVPLPDDFGGFEGMVTVGNTGTGGGYWPIKQQHEERIRALYAACQTTTGRPQMYAETQRKSGPNNVRSNRSDFLIWPITDADYTLNVPYYVLPDYLTTNNPYPYGSAGHAETMKAAARSAAELYLDNMPGPETANYMQSLAASISYDRRHQPKTLGVNTDQSDWRGLWRGNWPNGLWEPLGIGYLTTASFE